MEKVAQGGCGTGSQNRCTNRRGYYRDSCGAVQCGLGHGGISVSAGGCAVPAHKHCRSSRGKNNRMRKE